MATRTATRATAYHGGAKGQVVGPRNAARPAPAWRARNIPTDSGAGSDTGSKVLLSNLPMDVAEGEIIDLMKKTIGPVNVRDSLMIYTMKGFPRGMALIAFTRGGDAGRARERYNGKVIDGKRAIKLEVVLDRSVTSPIAVAPQNAPKEHKSLFERLEPRQQKQLPQKPVAAPSRPSNPAGSKRPVVLPAPYQPPQQPQRVKNSISTVSAPMRKRQKKGPRRVKKSVADLDREMEEYSAMREEAMEGLMQAI
ncbi:hypothetical protein M0805_001346 [Coniferiporia weirii]|nr:hypothetical protein M0805_001346 [Coniferiporia weirii]